MQGSRKRTVRSLVIATVMAMVATAGAWGQEQYSDAQLQAFLTAAIKVDQVIQDWTPKIRAAQSSQEQEQLVQSLSAEILQTIQATNGLTIDEYKAITEQATNDPQLAQRLEKMLRDQRPK
jgi:hypothetical protein